MATDNISTQTEIQSLMKKYTPTYKPLFSIFTKKTAYTEHFGDLTFVDSDIKSDIRASEMTAQDSEMAHVVTGEGRKTFYKYFKGTKYHAHGLQVNVDIQNIVDRIVNGFVKQLDEEIFTGEKYTPGSNGTIRNNGLFETNDKNAILKPTATLRSKNIDDVLEFFTTIVTDTENIIGNTYKTILLSGSLKTLLNKIVPGTNSLYKNIITQAFSNPVDLVPIPANLEKYLPVDSTYAQVLSLEAITLRYTALPRLLASGVNTENTYTWYKFFYGSAMVDVEQLGASIKYPVSVVA